MHVILFILLGIVLVGGSALVLLRTAKKPRIPDSVKAQPYSDDDDEDRRGW